MCIRDRSLAPVVMLTAFSQRELVERASEAGVMAYVAVSYTHLDVYKRQDLRWALALRADFVALSFVRSAADIEDVHAIMDEVGVRLPVIAKIEKPQAVDNLAEILEVFDGLMVARGDLDGRGQIGDGERLHHIGHHPGLAGPLDELTLGECGEHDDRCEALRADLLGRGDAVEDRHLDIQEHEVCLLYTSRCV